MPTLTPDRRKRLLAALRTGLSRESALAKLAIRPSEIEASGKRFGEELAQAEAAGSALIEATLLERGMSGDTRALELALARRGEREAPGATRARGMLEGRLDGMAERLLDDDREVASRIAHLLYRGGVDPARIEAVLAEARATVERSSEPAPVAPPPAPTMPEGYSLDAPTARVLRPDGTLAGHGLSQDRAIAVAHSDLARRTRVSAEDRTRAWSRPRITSST